MCMPAKHKTTAVGLNLSGKNVTRIYLGVSMVLVPFNNESNLSKYLDLFMTV